MNNKFTVEEVNLSCIFQCKSRTKVISDIKKAIKYLDDDEMVELSNRVVAKLDDMTDKEFAEMEFIVTEQKWFCWQSMDMNVFCQHKAY